MSDATKVLELLDAQKGDFEHLKKSVTALESANNAGEIAAVKERTEKIQDAMDSQAIAMENVVKSMEAEKAKTKAVQELQQGDNHEECMTFLKSLKAIGRGGSGDRFDTNDLPSSKKALAEHKASVQFNERDDAAGGITVLPVIDSIIGKLMREFSQVRGIASVATITGDQWIKLIKKQTNGAMRKTALSNYNDATKKDRFGEIKIMVDDLFSIIPFTDNLEMDTAFNIVGDILASAAEDFTITEGAEFISNGTGEGLKGLLTYADDTAAGNSFDKIAAIPSAASSLGFDDVWNLFYSLKTAYTPGAVAFANRLTMRELRKLKDTQDRYLWEFNNQVGQPATIGGYPIIEMPELTAPINAAGAFNTGDVPIIFGDFKGGYQIVDGMGIVTTRDNLTDYPNIVYKMKKRSGGGLIKGECIKKLKMV